MNILVTGCAGFIGSHATDVFLDNGYRVSGVDCLTYASDLKNLEYASKYDSFSLSVVDICETNKVKEIVEKNKCEWIVNFAAETHVDNSIKSIDRFIHSNIIGVKSLLEACKETNTKLFQISTDEVYGSIHKGSFSECDILNPRNPYSATKASAEHLITSYANTHDLKYIIVRPSNNFGPRQHGEKLLPTVLRKIRNSEKIPIYGDGQNVRDWLYVKNNAQMIERILRSSDLCQVYNITNRNELKNIKIIKKITDVLNLDFEASVEFITDRPGHDFRYSISDKKIKEHGFQFDSNFENDLNKTINEILNDG